ncbi:MAG: GNAT family N-acetyltransferase [Chloroflexota bacterium]
MKYKVEAANAETDYDALATFMNTFEPDPISGDDLREWDRRNAENILRRWLVRAEDETIIGYSVALQGTWNSEGEFYLWFNTDKAYRNRGIGQELYAMGLEFIQANNGTALTTEVSDDEAEGIRFAESRGFSKLKHTFQSKLDLQQFEETAFDKSVTAAQEAGIRFYTLADVEDTEENRRTLYEINRHTSLQDPGSDGRFPSFEQFNKDVFPSSWYRAEGQWLAAKEERVVGMCAVGYFQESNSTYNMMTGVHEEYRGRGIAQALKVLSARWAKAYGADYMRTNNNSENGPMLAINRKLGYAPQPGSYTMVKKGLDAN